MCFHPDSVFFVLFSIYSEIVFPSIALESWWKGKFFRYRTKRARALIIQRNSVLCPVNPTEIEQKFTFHKVSHFQGPKVESTLQVPLWNGVFKFLTMVNNFLHELLTLVALTILCLVCFAVLPTACTIVRMMTAVHISLHCSTLCSLILGWSNYDPSIVCLRIYSEGGIT